MPSDVLLGPAEVRALAAELEIRPTKKHGQNFVIDPNTVRKIVRVADLAPQSTVLEVGPGLGSLTLGLLEAGHTVVAVEIDDQLASRLARTVAERLPTAVGRLRVVADDALRVPSAELGEPQALVANLPYNVAVPVLLRLMAEMPTVINGLVMVQAEVAERLAAVPGSRIYGVPSVKMAWFADVTKAGSVGPKVFWPEPRVDSGLVRFVRRDPPDCASDRQTVFGCIDAAFSQRRKTLRSALAGWAGSAEKAAQVLTTAGIDPTRRGESLQVADFASIADSLRRAESIPQASD